MDGISLESVFSPTILAGGSAGAAIVVSEAIEVQHILILLIPSFLDVVLVVILL